MVRNPCLATLAVLALCSEPARADTQSLEVLATVRTNNRTASLSFRVPAHQSRVSELRIRSGSLAVTLVGMEIEFKDGGLHRIRMQESVPPGRQSGAIPVDPSRTVDRIVVVKQPGLRPGETTVQLLGKVAR